MPPVRADHIQTIALLHLASRPGALDHNNRLIERAATQASARGARLIVTPELCLSGYAFRDAIGTGWIVEQQAALLDWAARLAAEPIPASV